MAFERTEGTPWWKRPFFSDGQTTYSFFSDKPSLSPRVKAEIFVGVACGLCAIPLFFFEPISAAMLAVAAILFFVAAVLQYQKDQQPLFSINFQ